MKIIIISVLFICGFAVAVNLNKPSEPVFKVGDVACLGTITTEVIKVLHRKYLVRFDKHVVELPENALEKCPIKQPIINYREWIQDVENRNANNLLLNP